MNVKQRRKAVDTDQVTVLDVVGMIAGSVIVFVGILAFIFVASFKG